MAQLCFGEPNVLTRVAAATSGDMNGMVQAGHLTSSVLCILSLSGLAAQAAVRRGNLLGIIGVGTGIPASLAAAGFSPEMLAQLGGLAILGSLVGARIGLRISPTELPQTVAALHSVVGLAAVLTSIGMVMAHIDTDIWMLHMVTG